MALDIPTLLFVFVGCTITTALVVGLGAVRRPRSAHHAAWAIGAAFIATGGLLVAARGRIPDFLSIGASNCLFLLGMGLAWGGIALFQRRPLPWRRILLIPSTWIAGCLVPSIYGDLGSRIVLISLLCAVLAFCAARELWTSAGAGSSSQRMLSLLCFAQGSFQTFRAIYALITPLPNDFLHGGPLVVLSICEPIFVLFAALMLGIGMVYERSERALQRIASHDGLTGLLNRAAFLQAAEAALSRHGDPEAPATLLLFDLDRFKQINDSFGHPAGDAVIIGFAAVARRSIGEARPLGRIGGEEFAALLPGIGTDAAHDIAEQIRLEFLRCRIEYAGARIWATVSVGMATHRCRTAQLEEMLDRADKALYQAKREGRNRVRRALAA